MIVPIPAISIVSPTEWWDDIPFRKCVLPVLSALIALSACNDVPSEVEPIVDLRQRLDALPGVDVVEIQSNQDASRKFRLEITQPVDHANPDGPQFTQRAYLSHVDETMPMVFAPSGYAAGDCSGQEMAAILGSNCLSVTHRYYRDAQPDPLDWQHLTIEQTAADHHRIVETLKEIYTGIWLSAGVSKSGVTALFHRRFYPNDVVATIAYVSPFMFGTADPRFADFLATLGTEECRADMHRFQRTALEYADSLIPRFSAWHSTNGHQHPADTVRAFENAVRSYDWIFWQYYDDDCEKIPGPEASFDEILAHLHDIVNFLRVSDELAVTLRPYDYETLTQIGLPERRYDHIADLLTSDIGDVAGGYFDSLGVELVYDPSTVLDIYEWLQSEGDNIVYIYGQNDPWTAGAIELTGQANAIKVVQSGGNHSVKIVDLDDRQTVISSLEQWLGVPIDDVVTSLSEVAGLESDLLVPRPLRLWRE